MELSQLVYFQAVVVHHSVTQAAKQLNITQSAISKSIGTLENELGVSLFQRNKRSMVLSREGESFLHHVQRILSEVDAAKRELQELSCTRKKELRLRVETPEFLLGIIESFLKENPDTLLTQSYQSPRLEEALISGEINFSITSSPIPNSSIVWEPLMTETIYIMVNSDHPLANEKTVPLAALAEESFITFTSNPELQHATEYFCQLAGFTPNIVCEAGETPDLQKLVEMGLGIAFCSSCIRLRRFQDDAAFDESAFPFRYLTVTNPQCSRTIGLSYVRGRQFSPEDHAFYEFVRQYFTELDKQIKIVLKPEYERLSR